MAITGFFGRRTQPVIPRQRTGRTKQTALHLGRSDRIPVDRGQIAYLVAEVPDTLILQEIKT